MCAEVAAAESTVRVERDGSFGELPAEVATPLAMVLTELVQNAVEHAYPDPTPDASRVRVEVEREPAHLHVVVADEGRGLPDEFVLERSTRLGLQIVRTLVAGELRGELVLERRDGGGTRAVLDVPLAPGEPQPDDEP